MARSHIRPTIALLTAAALTIVACGTDGSADTGADGPTGTGDQTAVTEPVSTCDTERPAAYDVGVYDTAFTDDARDRTIDVRIRYPQGATGELPVAIVSHGGTGTPRSHEHGVAYLSESLAARGYVVVNPNHMSDRPTLERPADITAVLDALEAGELDVPDATFTPDLDRIGHAGHSWGAYTVMVTAGATTDRLPTTGDPRPDAFLALSPQGAGQFGFTDASWDAIDRPVYLIYGEAEASDNALGVEYQGDWRGESFEAMPPGDKYRSIVPGADHDDIGGGGGADGPVGLASQQFVVDNAVAFFDTYVAGTDRRCAIGTLSSPEGLVHEAR